jgi:vitamin B12 transporter
VRIRGAEANHTLLFVDGIKINDPAGDDSARFELLNADLASRIEVVRGPQSALWGSEAIGGVIAVNGTDEAAGSRSTVEGGSFGFARASASTALVTASSSIAGAAGWQRSTGIDSFGAPGGDRDGYRNLSGRLRASWRPAPSLEIGLVGLALTGASQFDGFDVNPPFHHTDTLDSSRNRLGAGRIWGSLGNADSGLSARVSASLLKSSNRNFLADSSLNRTAGTRRTLSAQLQEKIATGAVSNTLIAAAEGERETFHARDTAFGGATDQDRSRTHDALTFEWRAQAPGVTADAAIRHDMFNRFRDATSVRASLLGELGGGFALAGSYATGIAQPTFFDLYGAFPNIFLGNPSLKPESSRGFEASLRYRRANLSGSLTAYRQSLHNEIVNVTDPVTHLLTALNRTALSHRSGVEAEFAWQLGPALRLSANYAFLHASEPGSVAGMQVRELRRPRHSGSLALDGSSGKLSYGASLAYVGTHFDEDFDQFPAPMVRLGAYWLADTRIGYRLRPRLQVFARAANALNQHYEDAFGYRTDPRALYVGVSLGGS